MYIKHKRRLNLTTNIKRRKLIMNKVYVVFEDYDNGRETQSTIFSTKEKAQAYFDKIVDRETTQSWIKEDYTNYCETDTTTNFYAYDDYTGSATSIFWREKEIL